MNDVLNVTTLVQQESGWSSGVKRKNSETKAVNQWDTAEAEGQKPGAQQIPQGGQIGDGEVVRVQTPSPHHMDDEVSNIKEDGHLGEEENWAEKAVIGGEKTQYNGENKW